MDSDKISLIIKTREKVVFEGNVKAISSFNQVGPFDVLPAHANFISLIEKSIILHNPDGTKREIKIDIALMRVVENKVEIYLGIKTFFGGSQS